MSLIQDFINETAKKLIAFREAEPVKYAMLGPSIESVKSQAKYFASIYFTDQELNEVAHIFMKHFSAKGIKFYINGNSLYNPYSRSIMSDRPKKMVALGPLLS